MNLDNISEADLDRLLERLDEWGMSVDSYEYGLPISHTGMSWGYPEGRQIIREWLESLGDKS